MKHIVITILLISFICIGCKEAFAQEIKTSPNIVWITSEDNSKHYLKLFDTNGIETPHIESLAKHGVIFSHAFSNAPVCSAARSTIISGCYGPRVASHYHRRQQLVPMPESLKMFPAYLRDAGYYTTNNYKKDYNFIETKGIWDESSKKASWRNRKEGQPFFHVFNIETTHESSVHFSKEEMQTKATITNEHSFALQPNHPHTGLFRYTNAYYRDKIREMDQEVGEVIEALKKDGLMEETFVFYFGDHGGVLPGSKAYLYETGLHVPMVLHIPEKYKHLVDMKIGDKVTGFVSFVDLAPTMLNLAGLKIPNEIDGKPFLGKGVTKENLNARDETFSYGDRFDEKYDMVRSIRKGKYKYIRSYQPFYYDGLMNAYRYKQLAYQEWLELYQKGGLNKIQSFLFKPRPSELLFDVEADPYETINLAAKPAYKKTLLDLRTRLDGHLKAMPDLSFYPEFFLINNAFDNPVAFGKAHKAKIEKYINTSSYNLSAFKEVESKLKQALQSTDPWERYWALIVCSSFGSNALPLNNEVKKIASTDPEKINKIRAAEFLGLLKIEDPAAIMTNVLYESKDENEALLILNSIIFMRDAYYPNSFNLQPDKIHQKVKDDKLVMLRLKYLGAM